jgi:hypothetical protein
MNPICTSKMLLVNGLHGIISQKTEISMEGKISNTEVIRNLKGQNKFERRELS